MFKDFLQNRRGSISVLSAGAFCALLAVTSLVVEGSALYVTRVRQQRTADFASLAAGNLSAAIDAGRPTAAAIATAQNIATINGFASTDTRVAAANNGRQISVTIANTSKFAVTSLFSPLTQATTRTLSTTTPAVGALACLVSLRGEVSLSSGANAAGNNCGMVAKTYLELNDAGLGVKTGAVGYTRAMETPLVAGATTLSPGLDRFKFSYAVTDGLADEASVTTVRAALATMLSGWPYATASPVRLASAATAPGPNAVYNKTANTIPRGARIGGLALTDATLTFIGNGAADTSCRNPTTIDSVTLLSGASTLTFNSGCYIFKDDVILLTSTTVTFAIAAGAQVRFVFGGRIVNQDTGKLVFPAASYSIAKGLNNDGGGTLVFGAGPKVIGGTLSNGNGISDLGDGPFYFPGTTVRQDTGTLRFGAGPFHIYGSNFTNAAAGTMLFGPGPYYVYKSSIINGDGTSGAPFMGFAGGFYAFGRSQVVLNANSATTFGAGDMDLYASSMLLAGESVTFGQGANSATGGGTIRIAGGTLDHEVGNLIGIGITIAQSSGVISLTGRTLNLSAPTAAAPTAGYQNLLIYNIAGSVEIAPSAGPNILSGVIYAPAGSINVYNRTVNAPGPGCLSLVAGSIRMTSGAGFLLAPCANFPGLASPGLRAVLGG